MFFNAHNRSEIYIKNANNYFSLFEPTVGFGLSDR